MAPGGQSLTEKTVHKKAPTVLGEHGCWSRANPSSLSPLCPSLVGDVGNNFISLSQFPHLSHRNKNPASRIVDSLNKKRTHIQHPNEYEVITF